MWCCRCCFPSRQMIEGGVGAEENGGDSPLGHRKAPSFAFQLGSLAQEARQDFDEIWPRNEIVHSKTTSDYGHEIESSLEAVLKNKIANFRESLHLPSLNRSTTLHELLRRTLEDLQLAYPKCVSCIQISEINCRSTHQVLVSFYKVLKFVGDLSVQKKSKNFGVERDVDIESLSSQQLGERMLERLNLVSLETKEMFDVMEKDSVNSVVSECRQGKSSSNLGFPLTPTSVLSEMSEHHLPLPVVRPLRLNDMGKLNPLDRNRLVFRMVPLILDQNSNADGIVVNNGDDDTQSGMSTPTTPNSETSKSIEATAILLTPQSHPILQLRSPAPLSSTPTPPSSPMVIKGLYMPLFDSALNMEPIAYAMMINDIDDYLLTDTDMYTSYTSEAGLSTTPPPTRASQFREEPQPPSSSPASRDEPRPCPSPPGSPPPLPPPVAPPPPPPPQSRCAPMPPPPPSHPLKGAATLTPPPPLPPGKEGSGQPPPPLPPMSLPPLPPPVAPPPLPPPQSRFTPMPPPPPPTRPLKGTATLTPPPPLPPGKEGSGQPPPPLPPGREGSGQPPPPPLSPGSSPPLPSSPPLKAVSGPLPPVPPQAGGSGPPPPSFRALSVKNTKLKRSSQMGNLYRLLKGRVEGPGLNGKASQPKKSQAGGKSGGSGGQGMADALAEITRRSSYFQQIEEDVKNHGASILQLKSSISSFCTSDMAELTKFHKHVEMHLEKLTDESQVLARFEDFPTKKLETIRMAVALYSKLEAITTTINNWKLTSPIGQQLEKIESYFNKIKEEVDAIDRNKDEESKRFKSHSIEVDFNILVRIKESMVDLSSSCIEMALKESKEAKEANSKSAIPTKMLWRAFQLAFRVYNFAGGQDERADRLTSELAHEIETYSQI